MMSLVSEGFGGGNFVTPYISADPSFYPHSDMSGLAGAIPLRRRSSLFMPGPLRPTGRGLTEVYREFKARLLRPLNAAELNELGRILADGWRYRMEHAEDPAGMPHKPLSRLWLEYKSARAYDTRIWHQRTAIGTRAVDQIHCRITGSGFITVSCDARNEHGQYYAGLINDGWIIDETDPELITPPGPGKMVPARPVAGLSERDAAAMREAVERFYTERLVG